MCRAMEQFQDNNLEQARDDKCNTGDIEEDPSAETGFENNGLGDVEEDFFPESMPASSMEEDMTYTVAYQRQIDRFWNSKFREYVKRKKDVPIKDVVKEVALHFLPAKSLVRFRTVCKEWDHHITRPFFIHQQAQFSRAISGLFCQRTDQTEPNFSSFISLDSSAYGLPSPSLDFLPERVEVLSSCNGLLCCRDFLEDKAYYVCNPVNKQWKKLPQPKYYHGFSKPAVVLAFEPSAYNFEAHFDLICLVPLLDDSAVLLFEIYHSCRRLWRVSEVILSDKDPLVPINSGFYMNGMAYWETSCGKILAFDLKTEHCGIIPLFSLGIERGVLAEMNGELCYVVAHKEGDGEGDDDQYAIDFYGDADMKMKNRILLDPLAIEGVFWNFRALPCLDIDLLVLLVGSCIYSYRTRDQMLEFLGKVPEYECSFLPYVNSLVSLDADGGVDNTNHDNPADAQVSTIFEPE